MTKKVVVLSEPTPKRQFDGTVCAVVPHAMCEEDVILLSLMTQVRVENADELVAIRDKRVKPMVHQDALRFAGRAVFRPINPHRVDSPCSQGTSPALFTALVLARVFEAVEIEWMIGDAGPPQVSDAFRDICSRVGVEINIH